MKKNEPKKGAKLPVKMTHDMKADLEWIGDDMGDRSMAWVARKFIEEGIARYRKKNRRKKG